MHGFFTLRILFLDRFIRLAMPGFFIFRILSQTFDYSMTDGLVKPHGCQHATFLLRSAALGIQPLQVSVT